MESFSNQQFTRFVLAVAVLFLVQVLVNAWIDPYQLLPFRLSEQPKYYSEGDRVEKSARLRGGDFDTIIIGSSRVQVGMNPAHPAFADSKPYNMAMSAIDVAEYAKLLDYLQQHQQVKRLYLGLDFDSFAVPVLEPARAAFRENYENSLFHSAGAYSLHVAEYLLSFQTFFLGMVNTFMPEFSKTNVYSDSLGFMDKSVFHMNHREIFRAEMISRYTRAVFSAYDYDPQAEIILERELRKLARQNVEVVVFIPPVHGLMLELFEQLELYPTYEQWKRNLVRIVENVNQQENVSFTLWDFSGNSTISLEPIPTIEDSNARMEYFFEFSHFKENVGNMMIEAMAASAVFLNPQKASNLYKYFA